MPAIVSVKVISARDLPVMDRSSELTDAFVEIRMGQSMQRTDICKKTLNPVWDSPWFKFNVGEEELQEEPLTFKVMDYDQYSASDAIGRVYLLLASLFNSIQSLDGWFPIYDTLHGIRGEIHIKVSVELIKDEHKNKRSSSEVLLFSGQSIPEDYDIVSVHGFVEELLFNVDPEHQWIDKIRPPRASNESRQRTFLKLSGELQRKIGRKALDMEGNAIIGYTQSFDLEGESGIVVRGIGTCVSVTSASHHSFPTSPFQHSESLQFPTDRLIDEFDTSVELQGGGGGAGAGVVGVSPESANPVRTQHIARVSSSESDGAPSSPNRGVFDNTLLLGTSTGSGGGHFMTQLSFPFYTLSVFPAGFVTGLSGIVCARSVKLLDDINEPETRDLWWNEIRTEIRSHCRSMSCNAVLGYTETTSICDDLCILSGTGTAAVVTSLVDTKLKDLSKSGGEELDDTNTGG
ncbi:PREDICTED: C2 domain-containing protein 5-like [Amphimedon queenslandica]|nr:PREDICTED: C2 domain-containing protein 5-like [Amphimedon queenslandica]|eukprot:XP_019857459.1 PREDICTED: C2 domain-containing protein 5-like [Amphimedon queenslandica]